MSVDEVLFEKGGVFVHTSVSTGNPDEDILIGGKLRIVNRADGRYVTWEPEEEIVVPPTRGKADQGWAVVNTVSYHNGDNDVSDISVSPPSYINGAAEPTPIVERHQYKINFNIEELKSIKQSNKSFSWPYLIFIMKDGTTLPALHFHNGGSQSMMRKLRNYIYIKQSASDSRLYLVHGQDPHALHKSFDELNIFDTTGPALVSKFFKDPYGATLGGFSKVTNFVRDSLLQDTSQFETREDFAEMLKNTEIPALHTNDQEEPGYELITHAVQLPPRKNLQRGPPLTNAQWAKQMDKDGRVINVPELKETIFKGGIRDNSIRIEVWKFLLQYYPWESTYKERNDLRKKRVDDYFRMKLQWKSIDPDQAKRFSLYRERESLVEKDVNRTDRTHEFFQGQNNQNLTLLNDILMTYSMYHFDLGYVQGMSDLLAPILVVMENEVDSFWCFCGFMELVHKNFEMDQEGMKKQLAQLHTLVQFLDTELCNHLESHDSSNMFFCFRWLLIMFKREFRFSDVMRLWEVLWTGQPCPNFHLLICVAILDAQKSVMVTSNFGFNEILKHINSISFQIDLEETLRKAEAMYRQLSECPNLPRTVCDILSLPYQPTAVIDLEPSPLAETPDLELGGRSMNRSPQPLKRSDVDRLPMVGATSKNPIG